MKRTFACILGLALILLSSCSQTKTESRALTVQEIETANEAFETMLPAHEGEVVSATDSESDWILNPISHFFTSYYETPEQLDMGKFVYYIPRESFVGAEDKDELEKLKETGAWLPFDDIQDSPVPFGRIPFSTVEQYLQTYMNVSLKDMTNMGDALYLEDYETFYSYASDFGPGTFYCTRGEIRGDTVTLYGEDAKLTLQKDGTKYFITSHLPIE